MPNPQQNQSRAGYIILAVAVAILLFFYSSDMNASDTRVICFSEKQVEEIQQDVVNNVEAAFEAGHTQGMMDGYRKVVETVFAQCSLPEINDIVFKHPTGEIRLACPVK